MLRIKTKTLANRRFKLLNILIRKEKTFLIFIGVSFLLTGMIYPFPSLAMWLGFMLAAYSAIANDSIQTIGTFIASSADKKWWVLWLYIGGIFLATVSVSWLVYDGDVSYQRLSSTGFAQQPQSFHFLQVAAPIFLLIITKLRMPVSTTFLLLSSFSTASGALLNVMHKSIMGYFIAFAVAFSIWIILDKLMRRWFKGSAGPGWVLFQWMTSGLLWSLWIIQDAANLAVFLPRSLNIWQFALFSLTIFIGLGVIFYLRGDKIQEVVNEKSEVKDVRPATIIDLVYVLILVLFTWVSTVPMSTTWVFIGLLGGRELGLKIRRREKLVKTWKLIGKDVLFALLGLVISVVIALAANEIIRNEFFKSF